MSGLPVIYVAHPVGDGPEQTANLLGALCWLHALVRACPDHVLIMPWLAHCMAFDGEGENRVRGMRDNLEVVIRCDEVWCVGAGVSPGMREEADMAELLGKPVRDLCLGQQPPDIDQLAAAVAASLERTPA